MAETVNDDF